MSPGQILMQNITEIGSISLDDKTTYTKGCAYCIMHIPCKCKVVADGLHIPARIDNCRENVTITKLHPINLGLIKHFFPLEKLDAIEGETLFASPPAVEIPEIYIFEHKFSKIVQAVETTSWI